VAKYLFVVMTNAAEGADAEFNAWYDGQHLGDVLKLPGFVSAQRFNAAPGNGAAPAFSYLTLYEIETDDLAATQAALGAAAGGPAMPLSAAMDTSKVINIYFQASGEKRLA
jgi:hypothetical protein